MTLDPAASADGRHLVVRRGATVRLYTAEGERLAEAELPAPEGHVAFAGGRLLDVAGAVVTTFALPKLTRVSTLELPAPAPLLAITGRHLLLAARPAWVVHVGVEAVTYAPLRLDLPIDWAVGIDDEKVIIHGGRGTEVWSAITRRPEHKLKITVPEIVAHGVATQRSNLWLATRRAELLIMRVSDGKASRLPLPTPVTRAVGHPQSSWVVADLGEETYGINLVTGQCDRMPAAPGGVRALIARGTSAIVAQVTDEELELWEIG